MTEVLDEEVSGEEPVDSSADVAVTEDQAPVYNKKQVSDVVRREQQKAYEKGKREALMQIQEEQNGQQAQPEQTQAPSSLGGMAQMSPDAIKQMIADQAPQLLQEHMQQMQNTQTVDSFVQKMQAAEERHPGLEAKLNDLDWETLTPLVQMANSMENTGDIMAELLENPGKMGNLIGLMHMQPKLAAKSMHDLSNSIKENQQAVAENKTSKEPLGQIKSSNGAGLDSGKLTMKDFKRIYRG